MTTHRIHRIELITRDSQPLSFDCSEEQNLIEAAEAAQITLPSQCRQGSCGACHANVTTGPYTLGAHNAAALPSGSAQHGGTLMCRTTAQGNLSLSLPYDYSRILFQPIPQRNAHITAITPVAENTVLLELQLEASDEYGSAAQFEAGQFMELEIPGSEDKRAYSLSNTSNWDGRLEFLIRLQPNGKFSNFLNQQAQPGTALKVRGPQGAFGINEGSLRPRWFVAGGTGLAPMLAMLRRMAENQEMQEARLFFGVNRESELCMHEELERLQSELLQFKVDWCVWKPQGDWSGITGTPADALRTALADAAAADSQPDIYLCGPPALLDAAEKVAAEFGIPQDQVFSERFLAA